MNAQGPAPPLINQHKMHHSKVTKSSKIMKHFNFTFPVVSICGELI